MGDLGGLGCYGLSGVGVLVGHQQVYLRFNPCDISLDLLDPVVHLVETQSRLVLEQSLKLSGDSEDYLIC